EPAEKTDKTTTETKTEPASSPAASPVKSQAFLPDSRVQAAIASGLNSFQAEQAGNAYSAAVVRQLSQGVPLAEVMVRADQVFSAVVKVSAPSTPQAAAVNNLAVAGSSVVSPV